MTDKLKVRCSVCKKWYTARFPKGGDGSLIYPRRHKHNGKECDGNYEGVDAIEQKKSQQTDNQ